ncbi:hypothetical protein ABZ920_12390 [Streptomyces sp. NPDC046831]|uniref:hypothetical protein n=1 Tax=Streptomyces sp. NPDC046831 TaxID=3154805 RepID=UPI0033E9C324
MNDWIYILNPSKDTLDGEPSTKETIRRLAHEEPELDLWPSALWQTGSRSKPAVRVIIRTGMPVWLWA